MQDKSETFNYTRFTKHEEDQRLKVLDKRIERQTLILQGNIKERRKIVMRASRRAERARKA